MKITVKELKALADRAAQNDQQHLQAAILLIAGCEAFPGYWPVLSGHMASATIELLNKSQQAAEDVEVKRN